MSDYDIIEVYAAVSVDGGDDFEVDSEDVLGGGGPGREGVLGDGVSFIVVVERLVFPGYGVESELEQVKEY